MTLLQLLDRLGSLARGSGCICGTDSLRVRLALLVAIHIDIRWGVLRRLGISARDERLDKVLVASVVRGGHTARCLLLTLEGEGQLGH